jgi:hypothetical protein
MIINIFNLVIGVSIFTGTLALLMSNNDDNDHSI